MKRSANISNPVVMPNQNPGKPFPAWRLINGVKNASDGDLEASANSCEYWSWYFGGLVAFGLVAEVILGVLHPSYDSVWSRWGSTLANALIFIGVAGEVQFSRMGFRRDHEIKRRSDEKIAESILQAAEANQKASEAEARASEAQLALEKFKTPRSLSTEQQERITATLKLLATAGAPFDFTGIPFDFSILPDPETIALMGQIGSTLKAAGLSWEQWHGAPGIPVFNQPGMPQAGIVAFSGLMIQIDDAKTPEWGFAVNAIWSALNVEGVEAERIRIIDGTETPNAIHIYIGKKPQ